MMDPKHSSDTWISRRALLAGAAGVAGAAGAAMVKHTPAMADEPGAEGATRQTGSDPTKVPGRRASPVGRRVSLPTRPAEYPARRSRTWTASSHLPISTTNAITPVFLRSFPSSTLF